jgi:hypothetical protein
MFHKGLIPGLGLLLLAALFFAIGGCSDEKSTTPITEDPPTDTTVVGSLDDPEFAVVQDQINDYLTSSEQFFAIGLENIYAFPTDTETIINNHGAFGPFDTVAYDYKGGWHLIYIARYNTALNDFLMDSIQFKLGENVIEDPEGLDYLQFIRHWGVTDNRTDQTHTNKSGYINFQFENLDTEECTVNGTNDAIYEWNYVSTDSNVTAFFDMEVSVEDIVLKKTNSYGWNSGCPVSGELRMTIDESYSVRIGSNTNFWVSGWVVVIEFNDGVADVEVARGNVHWTYSCDICNPPSDF